MSEYSNMRIDFLDKNVIIKKIDNKGYSIDTWIFEKDKLSKNQKVFVDNMMSMSKSMISEKQEENERSK